MNCWSCNEPITDQNKSKEHIFPDSIGGAKGFHSEKLLCKDCNSTFGSTIDSVFQKQLKHIIQLIGVSRDRKKKKLPIIRGITKSGKVHYTQQRLQGVTVLTIDLDGIEPFDIVRNNRKDAIDEARKILNQLKNKNKFKGDVEEKLREIKFEGVKQEELVYFSNELRDDQGRSGFGGLEFHQAMVKTAINFALFNGVELNYLKYAISFVKSNRNNLQQISSFFYPDYKVLNNEVNEISHSIHLLGHKDKRVLYTYFEFFSFIKIMVLLSGDYEGEEIYRSYSYDILKDEKIKKEFTLSRHRLFYLRIPNTKFNATRFKEEYDRLMTIIERLQ
jgi:hypothetical protein